MYADMIENMSDRMSECISCCSLKTSCNLTFAWHQGISGHRVLTCLDHPNHLRFFLNHAFPSCERRSEEDVGCWKQQLSEPRLRFSSFSVLQNSFWKKLGVVDISIISWRWHMLTSAFCFGFYNLIMSLWKRKGTGHDLHLYLTCLLILVWLPKEAYNKFTRDVDDADLQADKYVTWRFSKYRLPQNQRRSKLEQCSKT